MAYYFKNDFKSAIHYLQKAIKLDKKNSDAKINLASVYFNQKHINKAKELYLNVSKDLEYNKQFRTYYNLGLIYLKEKRINKAISMFKKSVDNYKSYCPAHYKLGEIAMNNYNYFKAINHFENAYSGSCYNNPAPYFQEAISYYHLREYGKATMKFEKIIKKFPQSKEAILARRKVNHLKINELRNNTKQALKYQLNTIKNKYEKGLGKEVKEIKEKKVNSPQF